MKNIDAELVKIIDDRIQTFQENLDNRLTDDRIESIIDLLIKSRVEIIIVQKTTDFINGNPQFLNETIDALFKDDRYLESLKDSIKQNVCHELERKW